MTNPDFTAVSLLVDRSGSMSALAEEATAGIAKLIADQKALPGKCTVRLCHFDDEYEVVYPSTPVATTPRYRLVPRGMTALLDAWGKCMTEFGEELAALAEEERPANVVFVVVTDGLENASQEWTREKVLSMVQSQTDEWNWQFIYLAANQDAVAVGRTYGVAANNSMTFDNTGDGTQVAYASASASLTRTRKGEDGTLNP